MLKRWVPASFIAAALALAIAGGAVLAAGGADDSRRADIFDRAATILGIESSDLQDAHDQAKREAHDERLTETIAQLITAEIIDQSEADNFTEWMAGRPDSANEELISKLTSSIISSPGSKHLSSKFELRRLDRNSGSRLTDRIAEILGIDPTELADALNADETITANEADELHDWVDTMPQWILDLDIYSRLLPAFGLFPEEQHGRGLFEQLPFGRDRNRHGLLERLPFGHFGEGDREFNFEYDGPEGHFQFGPGEHNFPFDPEQLDDLLEDFEMFEGLEGIGGFSELEGLFERFEGHEFFNTPFEQLLPPMIEPDASTTSA
jgi:hypothetical protein